MKSTSASSYDARDTENQALRRGMSAVESQLNSIKDENKKLKQTIEGLMRQQEQTGTDATSIKKNFETASEQWKSEKNDLQKTLQELRVAVKKYEERPGVPGSGLDLKALPVEAVQELARYYRKGEDYEKLYRLSQNQIQLAQEKSLELQRRYFAVCRELAVAAGRPTSATDQDVHQFAQSVLAASDKASQNKQSTHTETLES
jgi:chromosome segregation ATPase